VSAELVVVVVVIKLFVYSVQKKYNVRVNTGMIHLLFVLIQYNHFEIRINRSWFFFQVLVMLLLAIVPANAYQRAKFQLSRWISLGYMGGPKIKSGSS